jgi:hypothetical protein
MNDDRQGVGNAGLIGAELEALGQRGNIGIRDPTLGVGNALEVEDRADLDGIGGPRLSCPW